MFNIPYLLIAWYLVAIRQKKSELGVFPSSGLKRTNQAPQSIILSDVDDEHGCNNQEVEFPN